jgi:hypothetical protein
LPIEGGVVTAVTAREPDRSAGEEPVAERELVAVALHVHGVVPAVDAAKLREAAVDARLHNVRSSDVRPDLPSELAAILTNRTTGAR